MKFDFGVAHPADDAEIRRLLARNPMPGLVTVAFEREPSYFLGHGVMGDRCETLTATDRDTGRLAAIMCLAAADRYVSGRVRSVGYVGQIRVDSRYRGYLMPMRSAAFIRERAKTGWPDLWFSAIVDDNPTALEIFANRSRPTSCSDESSPRIASSAWAASPSVRWSAESSPASPTSAPRTRWPP